MKPQLIKEPDPLPLVAIEPNARFSCAGMGSGRIPFLRSRLGIAGLRSAAPVAMRSFFLALATVGLTACAIGPDYRPREPAELGIPASWHARFPHGGSVAELTHWWYRADDPVLTQFIEAAEVSSPSMAFAAGRVRAARAGLQSNRAPLLPSIQGIGSVTRATSTNTSGTSSDPLVVTSTHGALDAHWELDVLGGTRRSVAAGRAMLETADADWHDARVTLAAEVANAYATARYYQRLVSRYEEELTSRRATHELTEFKIREGFLPPTAALSTDASAALAASTLEQQRGQYALTLNRLAMLTGLAHTDIESALGAIGNIPRIDQPIDYLLPAYIISQRPDVRSSERQLAAASESIGVAMADALPSLTLGGFIGVNRVRVGGANTTQHSWSFGPALNIPVFSGGAYAARIESARAAYDQMLASYRAIVLAAVNEIEDALVRIDAISHRRDDAERAATNFRAFFVAMERSYREGKSSLLELEDARRQSLLSEEQLLSIQVEEAQAWIALYKAAGGGWETSAATATP